MHDPKEQLADKVFIRDLTIEMFAGIYDFERENKQRVIINIHMYVQNNESEQLKDIDDVVSYEDVVNKVKDIANARHYDLLESFAEDIASLCLLNNKVRRVLVRAEKPDIIEETKTVGIEIIRTA